MTPLERRLFVGGALSLAALFPASCSQTAVGDSFDYIIVGGGSAGCVLARRLSNDRAKKVLLLEAGEQAQHEALNSGLNWFSMLGSDLAFQDMTTPQPSLDEKQIFAAHGKVLGGSSVINAMIHHRPTPYDLDSWNIEGWRWRDLAPMFAKSETYLSGPSSGRGTDGPIGVTRLPDPTPLAQAALEAAESLGLGALEDINAGEQVGVGLNQLAFADGLRQHTGLAYLAPVAKRENLTVLTGTSVTKLLFDGTRCRGVQAEKGGALASYEAGRVILSAGALRTPQLLMLSGIGPADHLRAHHLPVVLDQPQIGENLHDHLLFSGHNFAAQGSGASAYHGSVAALYAVSDSGSGNRDIMGNISSNARVFPPLESAESGYKTSFSFTKPHSRGTLRLKDANPASAPVLNHKFLSDPRDVRGALEALATSRRFFADKAFTRFEPKELNTTLLETQEGRRRFLNLAATSFGHHSGTCAMGGEDRPVCRKLRVRGVENLSICDASVIPFIPSCPTNALVVAMAERAVDLLA